MIFYVLFIIVQGIILMDFDLKLPEDHTNLNRAAFMMQAFRHSTGDFVVDNFIFEDVDTSFATYAALYLFLAVYTVMQVIVFSNFMIAIVSDVFETDYTDVAFYHQL